MNGTFHQKATGGGARGVIKWGKALVEENSPDGSCDSIPSSKLRGGSGGVKGKPGGGACTSRKRQLKGGS